MQVDSITKSATALGQTLFSVFERALPVNTPLIVYQFIRSLTVLFWRSARVAKWHRRRETHRL